MAFTMQAVLDRARIPLNDTGKDRYFDADMIVYANDAILRLRKGRPDLFIGLFLNYPSSSLAVGATFPLADEYVPAVADYVTARSQFVDSELTRNGMAAAFFALFEKQEFAP